jgi:Rap1a immunity proteins
MKIGFALTLVLLAMTAFGQDTQKRVTASIPASVSHWVTMTGNDLYPTCLAWEKTEDNGGHEQADTVIKGQTCYSFILGVINAYPASTSFPVGTTNEQIVDVAINYLKEHPAERGKAAWLLILKSEEAAFHVKWLLF